MSLFPGFVKSNIPSLMSFTTVFPVSKAWFIVVKMTPTGPVLTQPVQYIPKTKLSCQYINICNDYL